MFSKDRCLVKINRLLANIDRCLAKVAGLPFQVKIDRCLVKVDGLPFLVEIDRCLVKMDRRLVKVAGLINMTKNRSFDTNGTP